MCCRVAICSDLFFTEKAGIVQIAFDYFTISKCFVINHTLVGSIYLYEESVCSYECFRVRIALLLAPNT